MARTRYFGRWPLAVALTALFVPDGARLYAADQLSLLRRACDLNIALAYQSIEIVRASDGQQLILHSGRADRVFGYSVQHFADVDGDGWNDVVVASPPTSTAANSGTLQLLSPETGATIWQTGGPVGMRSCYLAIVVDDQDYDGVPDIGVAAYDTGFVPYTWLVSGKSGHTLALTKEDVVTAKRLMEQGKVLYSPSDVDGSKLVDINDILQYLTIPASESGAEIVKDGVVDSLDLSKLVDDSAASVEVVVDKVDSAAIPNGLAAMVLNPEGTDPWCHHVWLASLSVAGAGTPAISTVCTPEAVLLMLMQALEAAGYTAAQIIAILAGMGFSATLIARVLNWTAADVERVLSQTTDWLWCRNLYAAYKAACALAGSCKGPADPSKCASYGANFLANATCAIMRSKHMTRCIPQNLRPMWDPSGGHGQAIVQRWRAAAKCASLFAAAGCGGSLPPLNPTPIPGLPTIEATAAAQGGAFTVGLIAYSDSGCNDCVSTGADRYADVQPGDIDWAWIEAELARP